MTPTNAQTLLQFFHEVGKLKTLVRTGWTRLDVPAPESVADHSFRMVVMAMILGERSGLDAFKLVKMCIIHDLPEIIAGDITPYDGLSKEDKHQREKDALALLVKDLSDGEVYMALWQEYEDNQTPEAQMARQIDKLEMAIQAQEYQAIFPDKDFSEFMNNAASALADNELCLLMETLRGKL